jgi:hypothetical protein
MRLALSYLRAATLALAGTLLGQAGAFGDIIVDYSPAPGNAVAAQPSARLSPEVEAKLATFVASAKVEKQKQWEARMTEEIAAIVQATGLDPARAKTLEAAANQAVAAGLDGWAANLRDRERTLLTRMGDRAQDYLQQILPQAAVMATSDWNTDVQQPYEQDAWKAAVHQTLTPDQAAAWDKAQAARLAGIEADISSKTVKPSVDRVDDQQAQEIQSACAGIEAALSLPKDRADKLEALAKNLADQGNVMVEKKLARMFLAMLEDQRQAITTNGNIYFGLEPNELPSKQAAWTQGVAGILTADEMNRLQAQRDAKKAKRAQVMSRVLLTMLDDKIAFTEAQRQKLGPLAERLVKDSPELLSDDSGYGFPSQLFFSVAAKAPEKELAPVLDDLQLQHWRKLSAPQDAASDGGKAAADDTKEPEDVEQAISLYLYEKAEERRKHLLEESDLKAEDAVRSAKLSAAAAIRLEAAARGEAEESLSSWKWFVEQQVRGQLQNNLTPQNVRQRLESLQNFMFQQGVFFNRGAQTSIWDATVASDLTDSERNLWTTATDARSAFHDKAVADFILANFDHKYQLTDDQWQKLQPLLAGIIHDNSADIARMFSAANNSPWFLMDQFALMPFAGISDADLKAILTKDQMTRWSASPDFGNCTSWWTNIQQIHNQQAQQAQQMQQIQQQQRALLLRRAQRAVIPPIQKPQLQLNH